MTATLTAVPKEKQQSVICFLTLENVLDIGSLHPSESGTITAFWGEKGESQPDEKGNVFNTLNMRDRYIFPFASIINLIDPN